MDRIQLEQRLRENPGDIPAMEAMADLLAGEKIQGDRLSAAVFQAEKYYRAAMKGGSRTAKEKLQRLLGQKTLVLAKQLYRAGNLSLARSMALASRLYGCAESQKLLDQIWQANCFDGE